MGRARAWIATVAAAAIVSGAGDGCGDTSSGGLERCEGRLQVLRRASLSEALDYVGWWPKAAGGGLGWAIRPVGARESLPEALLPSGERPRLLVGAVSSEGGFAWLRGYPLSPRVPDVELLETWISVAGVGAEGLVFLAHHRRGDRFGDVVFEGHGATMFRLGPEGRLQTVTSWAHEGDVAPDEHLSAVIAAASLPGGAWAVAGRGWADDAPGVSVEVFEPPGRRRWRRELGGQSVYVHTVQPMAGGGLVVSGGFEEEPIAVDGVRLDPVEWRRTTFVLVLGPDGRAVWGRSRVSGASVGDGVLATGVEELVDGEPSPGWLRAVLLDAGEGSVRRPLEAPVGDCVLVARAPTAVAVRGGFAVGGFFRVPEAGDGCDLGPPGEEGVFVALFDGDGAFRALWHEPMPDAAEDHLLLVAGESEGGLFVGGRTWTGSHYVTGARDWWVELGCP